MLTVDCLSKSFGKFRALREVGFQASKGQSISLIGPNGSGKTTLIKCLLGLVIPDGGSVNIHGQSIRNQWEYRRFIGYMPQIGRYPDHLKVGQLLDLMREVRGGQTLRVDDDLEKAFRIDRFVDKPMRALSGGMRQKVNACMAFMFDPDFLILDEPTAGLDPLASEVLKEKIGAEKKRGKLILVTSHILSDLEEITSDIIYLIDGKIRFYEPVEKLLEETQTKTLNRAIAHIMRSES